MRRRQRGGARGVSEVVYQSLRDTDDALAQVDLPQQLHHIDATLKPLTRSRTAVIFGTMLALARSNSIFASSRRRLIRSAFARQRGSRLRLSLLVQLTVERRLAVVGHRVDVRPRAPASIRHSTIAV